MSKYQIIDGDFSTTVEGWMGCREALLERYGDRVTLMEALKSKNVTINKIDDVTKDAYTHIMLMEVDK